MASSDYPVDFEAADCAAIPVSADDRPAGNIPYRIRPVSYRESYTFDHGSFQQVNVLVAWADANDFIDYALGFVAFDPDNPARFRRVLPLVSPFQSTVYCDSCELQTYAVNQGDIRTSATAGRWPEADVAEYALTFRPRLYALLTDDQVDGDDYPWADAECRELGRFVERHVQYVPTEKKVPQFSIETYNPAAEATPGDKVGEVGFVIDHRADVYYVWHRVPFDAIPLAAIDAASGCVNNAPFDFVRNVAGDDWEARWETGTLLFNGVPERIQPYAGPNGEMLADVAYHFSWRPKGWNKIAPPNPDPAADWVPVRRATGSYPPSYGLYGVTDLRELFLPRS